MFLFLSSRKWEWTVLIDYWQWTNLDDKGPYQQILCFFVKSLPAQGLLVMTALIKTVVQSMWVPIT